ncbi:MAG: hypothetical protein ACJ8FT_06115 [Sphingomonas sp.]
MRWILAAGALVAIPISASAHRRPVIHDAVALNIGVNCQWQSRCIALHRAAMNRALDFVARKRPPQWRVQLCNRNASRGGNRIDWIGFDHCIRNAALKPAVRVAKKRKR